jgi:hypothetical protein
VPDVVVSSPFGNVKTKTDAGGNYVLAGLPDGNWPVLCTKDGWTFYPNPQTVNVAGGDAPGTDFVGNQNSSNFLPHDPQATRDDAPATAAPVDLEAGPVEGTVSIVDDSVDWLRFSVTTPGQYFVELENDNGDIYFPNVSLFENSASHYLGSTSFAFRGTVCFPLIAAGPRDYLLEVQLSGGGGGYRVTLKNGPVYRLSGTILDGAAFPVNDVIVTVTNTATNQATQYYTNTIGLFVDYYREAANYDVEPGYFDYSFAPMQSAVDLTGGPYTSANFTATQPTLGNDLEPNDSQVQSDMNATLVLPYSSAVADDLSIDSASDTMDYYRVIPAAGKGLHVSMHCDTFAGNFVPFQVQLLDNDFSTPAGTAFETPDGYDARLASPADGGSYYIRVTGSPLFGNFRSLYRLEVESYDPVQLKTTVQLGGTPLPGARVTYRDEAFNLEQVEYTDVAGATPTLLVAQGETFNIEVQRYGIDIDRHTQRVTMGAGAANVLFNADPANSPDQLEPNNDPAGVPANSLPFSVGATLSPNSDSVDYYRVTTTDSRPLQVGIASTAGSGTFSMELYDDLGNFINSAILDTQAISSWLVDPLGGAATYRLVVYSPGFDATYSLTVDAVDAYRISGTATKAGVGVAGTVIHCPETGSTTTADSVTGAYDLGLFLPGTYTLNTYCANNNIMGPPSATVTNVDQVVNFVMGSNAADIGEPNNSSGTAFALTPDGVPVSGASVDWTGDTDDWYSFNATAGQLVLIRAEWGAAWQPGATIVDVLDPAMNVIGSSFGALAAYQEFSFVAPSTGTYRFDIGGGPQAYSIAVSLQ